MEARRNRTNYEAKKTENLGEYLTKKGGLFIFQPPSMTFRFIPIFSKT